MALCGCALRGEAGVTPPRNWHRQLLEEWWLSLDDEVRGAIVTNLLEGLTRRNRYDKNDVREETTHAGKDDQLENGLS